MQVFASGIEQDITSILANKDWRAQFQTALMEQYPAATILAVKLNIPGKVKNNQVIEQIFTEGWNKLLKKFDQQSQSTKLFLQRETGPEGFIVVLAGLRAAKVASVEFEQAWPLGRLFDVDVMSKQAQAAGQISRTKLNLPVRQCFICDLPAKECARLQRHSKAEITAAIDKLVTAYFGE
ncbi:holo-ACP synthase [Weissella oryzae SG25]|uniref:citrate lyase holo-[acyl-carrier protein] synthase n=1 Tax=Weissella oryzae (strain DSM 25784 / JCM 18191 / LMG 30913 / SG25) TaxID=1329250 RepID=A0A069CUF6_WEIOS|nr:citrate lyase holo-[acyl-carrier protein] synthase [Weissella oryzae]GAK30838.1 holo-ACP synthase [Weissella oryzae SG25]